MDFAIGAPGGRDLTLDRFIEMSVRPAAQNACNRRWSWLDAAIAAAAKRIITTETAKIPNSHLFGGVKFVVKYRIGPHYPGRIIT